jgi:hypothetical protein
VGLSANLQPPIKVRRAILEEEIDDMRASGKGLACIFWHMGVVKVRVSGLRNRNNGDERNNALLNSFGRNQQSLVNS